LTDDMHQENHSKEDTKAHHSWRYYGGYEFVVSVN